MKKIILSVFLFLHFVPTFACDICGCGVGGNYIGLLPDFNKRFIGLRYQFNQLTTQLDVQGNRSVLTTDEKYQSMELWGAWNIKEKWRVLSIIPYNFNEKFTEGNNSLRRKNGLSDLVIHGYYQLFGRSSSSKQNKLIVQGLWLGMGLKLPSGKYDVQEQKNAQSVNPNIFQLGTGSLDFIPSLMYDIRIQDFGINSNVSYKINTENKDHYRYGNKIAGNASAYYKIALGKDKRIAPNLGLAYENQWKDRNNDFLVHETGGDLLNGNIGLESNLNKLSLGINFQKPIHQDLGNHRIHAGNRILTHISYSF